MLSNNAHAYDYELPRWILNFAVWPSLLCTSHPNALLTSSYFMFFILCGDANKIVYYCIIICTYVLLIHLSQTVKRYMYHPASYLRKTIDVCLALRFLPKNDKYVQSVCSIYRIFSSRFSVFGIVLSN